MKKFLTYLPLFLIVVLLSCNHKSTAFNERLESVVERTEDVVDNASEFVEDAVVSVAKEAMQKNTSEAKVAATPQKTTTRKLELPGRLKHTPERIVEHTGFTLSFNREHNNPNWVAWELTAEEAQGELPRNNDFEPDPLLPENHQVKHADYTRSGYDRGHMVPAADMKWSLKAMNDCFYMSNICPQTHTLNAGGWETLESACRRWAKQEGSVYIVCGPVYKGTKHKTIGKNLKITVPEGFFKVVLSMRKGEEKAIGFYYANSNAKQKMEETATTVDAIEELTGMDFFVNIDDRLEQRIESTFSLKKWK